MDGIYSKETVQESGFFAFIPRTTTNVEGGISSSSRLEYKGRGVDEKQRRKNIHLSFYGKPPSAVYPSGDRSIFPSTYPSSEKKMEEKEEQR